MRCSPLQEATEAPPLSMRSISSGDQTLRRKRAGSSSRSKKTPWAGLMEGRAAAGAPPMPASATRVHVLRRGPYCWERWRYSEKEAWEVSVKSEGREFVGEAGWG